MLRVRIWSILGVQGLDLAHFGAEGLDLAYFWVPRVWIWPIFGPFWGFRACIWLILGAEGLDLALFIRPILVVQGLDLNHFRSSRTGFGPFSAHFWDSEPGFGPSSARFGGSGTGFEPFWVFKDRILPIFCLNLAHYLPILGVLTIDLGNMRQIDGSGHGFRPFSAWIRAFFRPTLGVSGPGYDPFSAYFGGSGHISGPFQTCSEGCGTELWPLCALQL